MAFLQFLLFIGIILFFAILAIVVRFYLTIRKTAKKFRNFTGSFNGQTTTDDGEKTYRHKGVTIIDPRDANTRNRKIFTDDVGDYVKYKEVK